MRAKSVAISITVAMAFTAPAFAFELDERLLDLSSIPFRVDQAITAEQLSALHCIPSESELLVCITGVDGLRVAAVMVQKTDTGSRINSLLVTLPCDPTACAAKLKEAIDAMTVRLGAGPGDLGGDAIWRDREKNRRDLIIAMNGTDMISVILLRSDP